VQHVKPKELNVIRLKFSFENWHKTPNYYLLQKFTLCATVTTVVSWGHFTKFTLAISDTAEIASVSTR